MIARLWDYDQASFVYSRKGTNLRGLKQSLTKRMNKVKGNVEGVVYETEWDHTCFTFKKYGGTWRTD
jgi:hypothetical protein